jgi:GTP-binding protein
MKFVDEALIEIVGGHGGRGMISFRREAHVPCGGPNGGDGGRGGDVIAVADARTVTLLDHRYHRSYKGAVGGAGGSSECTGKNAPELVIPMPPGTLLIDEDTGEVLADLAEVGDRFVLAKGGRGGKGNAHFKGPVRRGPRFAQTGEAGESRRVRLSLKLVADVGLLGMPNAGKSTFIRSVSGSKAKVAEYPFTTLVPNLGVVRVDERSFVMADIPGLVPGASEGHGLGDRFLKHVDRTRVLVHLVSISPDATDPLEAWRAINAELAAHSKELSERPQVVVLNKIDLIDDRYEVELWQQAFKEEGVELLAASGLSGENTLEVLRRCAAYLETNSEGDPEEPVPWSPI